MSRKQCKYDLQLRVLLIFVIADFLYDSGLVEFIVRWLLEVLIYNF